MGWIGDRWLVYFFERRSLFMGWIGDRPSQITETSIYNKSTLNLFTIFSLLLL